MSDVDILAFVPYRKSLCDTLVPLPSANTTTCIIQDPHFCSSSIVSVFVVTPKLIFIIKHIIIVNVRTLIFAVEQ